MTQVIIDNPVLNSPYAEPSRYRLFDDDGITNDVKRLPVGLARAGELVLDFPRMACGT